MLIEKRRWAGIQDGSITVLSRRWRHRQATAGKTYRTAAGRIHVVGRDRVRFKADVRKLESLGLTISLETGYRLSPRGETLLRRRSM